MGSFSLLPAQVAASSGHAKIVDTLLAAGAPWSAQDKQGLCAGDHAIQNEHMEVANQILDAGGEEGTKQLENMDSLKGCGLSGLKQWVLCRCTCRAGVRNG